MLRILIIHTFKVSSNNFSLEEFPFTMADSTVELSVPRKMRSLAKLPALSSSHRASTTFSNSCQFNESSLVSKPQVPIWYLIPPSYRMVLPKPDPEVSANPYRIV
jgi:hypothetical protein